MRDKINLLVINQENSSLNHIDWKFIKNVKTFLNILMVMSIEKLKKKSLLFLLLKFHGEVVEEMVLKLLMIKEK